MLLVKEHPYLPLACGPLMCSVNSLLMTSRAVGTEILVKKRAETSKDTSSSLLPICTDLRYPLKLLLSFTNEGVIAVYFWRILVRNLANWYVVVPQAETMGCMGQLALWSLGRP